MKFKLDENFDWKLAAVVAEGGHEADTVKDEKLSGKSDETIYQACVADGRILITMDLDLPILFDFRRRLRRELSSSVRHGRFFP